MITRDALVNYLNDYLACETFQDYAPNGMQIQGKEFIKKICTAVTASYDVIELAVKAEADVLLVHHGYFWRGEDAVITGIKHARIAALIKHDISLLAYHLPLDAHLTLGNNACLGAMLPVTTVSQTKVGNVPNLLWFGDFDTPMLPTQLKVHLSQQLSRDPLWINANDKPVKRVAWCTGGADDYIVQAHELGADAYISGEVSERTYYLAKELGVHYYAAGHHATERGGIYQLGEHLSSHFSIPHQFIDSDNPV